MIAIQENAFEHVIYKIMAFLLGLIYLTLIYFASVH